MWPFNRKRASFAEEVLERARIRNQMATNLSFSTFMESTRLDDEPNWDEPTDSEREWARATMPWKASGHVIGWRTWGVTDVFGATEMDSTNTEDLLSLSSEDCWTKLFNIYRETEKLRDQPMYRLRSVSMAGYQWPTHDPVIAIDENTTFGQTNPRLAHGPGVYAYKHEPTEQSRVWGKVALWGDVVEHGGGYRARYAYPVELWINDPKADMLADHLSKAYGLICHVAGYDDISHSLNVGFLQQMQQQALGQSMQSHMQRQQLQNKSPYSFPYGGLK